MKTVIQNQQATVVLRDGNTKLAAWDSSFEKQPTIGECIEIPASLLSALAGYESKAVVSRIELRDPLSNLIDLTANCITKRKDRPVIVLNSSRIPESFRNAAEVYLRSALKFPLIDWERSNQPNPVVRFHDPATGQKSCPADVRAGLLGLLHQSVSV